jgi:hypothetical protein
MERIVGITVEHLTNGYPIYVSKKDKSPKMEVTENPPRGYVTLEQFAEDTKKIINDYCNTRAIHKKTCK